MVGVPFGIHESHETGLIRLTITGELDVSSAPALRDRLSLLRTDSRVVRLDLSKVGFMDSTGLQCLLEAVQGAGGLIEVEPDLAPQVRRVMELTRTERVILARAAPND